MVLKGKIVTKLGFRDINMHKMEAKAFIQSSLAENSNSDDVGM